MAGLWHLSHHQMRDPNGTVYAGARAYFYEAATSAKITVYQDYGLGTAHPNPVEANAYGVFPPVFLDEADEFYRQTITASDGVTIPGTDVGTIPIIGPSGGGGGSEVPVDPNSLFATGDVLWKPSSGSRAGWVRSNGRTIGSASSGAAERANSDCEQLFLYLWQTYSDTLCPVTGGRGANAAADWAANKPIGTLNMRNKAPFGLDDMGNSAANGFTGVTFTVGDATTAASFGGAALHTLTISQIPSHPHTATLTDPGHKHREQVAAGASGGEFGVGNVNPGSGETGSSTFTQISFTGIEIEIANTGGGGAHNNMPPFMLGTWYMRL